MSIKNQLDLNKATGDWPLDASQELPGVRSQEPNKKPTTMNENVILKEDAIINRIYMIRGVKVMLDRDLAEMYDVKPIRLREQVKRNIERFPENFMFQLNSEEVEKMVSQNAIPSIKHLGGHMPYVFSEYGILQLANVLRSNKANQMSIKIIEIFIKMREMLANQKDLILKIEQLEKNMMKQNQKNQKYDEDIDMIFNALKQLLHQKNEPRKPIGFK
jgi:hypothetical protein